MRGFEGLFWTFVACGAFAALVVVGIPLLFVARALHAAAPGRWAWRRWLAASFLVLDAATLLLALGAAFEPQRLSRARDAYVEWSLNYDLRRPRMLGGVRFPAGSHVMLDQDGEVQSGTLPAPTVIAGLPLVGNFVGRRDEVLLGTLAAPATVEGVPCGPGRLSRSSGGSVSCILARDHAFAGHMFAAGQPFGVEVLPGYATWLDHGTLARPELLFGVSWPAGAILDGIPADATPERLAHGTAPADKLYEVCLLPGQSADVPGATPGTTLHGTLTYGVQGGERVVSPGCKHAGASGAHFPNDGHASVGAARYTDGLRSGSSAAWRWSVRESAGPTP